MVLSLGGAYWEKGAGEGGDARHLGERDSSGNVCSSNLSPVFSYSSSTGSSCRPNSSMGMDWSPSRGGRYLEWSNPNVPGAYRTNVSVTW